MKRKIASSPYGLLATTLPCHREIRRGGSWRSSSLGLISAQCYLGVAKPGEIIHRRLTVWANDGSLEMPRSLSIVGSQASETYDVTMEVAQGEPHQWEVSFRVQVKSSAHAVDKVSGIAVLTDQGRPVIEIPLEGFVGNS
jgi:hypothetical protein